MKEGDFFFNNGSYYVIKKVDNAAQRIYYTVFYFYATHPDKSLHIDNGWRTFVEFHERFYTIEWNVFNEVQARKMIIRLFKE